jgi:FdhD protein
MKYPIMATAPLKPASILYVKSHQVEQKTISIINEIDLSLTVNGEHWITFLCTPQHQVELALGFLYNEAVIQSLHQVEDIRLCESGDNVDIWLSFSPTKPKTWKRTSGCSGGVTSTESEVRIPKPITVNLSYTEIYHLISLLYDHQQLYQSSGGIHISALSNNETIIYAVEDIGRHNTLDKLSGMKLLHSSNGSTKILLTSGRVSSEMMQKAIRMDSEIVISRTAPSAFAIDLATQSGVTLIGYAKRNQFILYTHPERINP